MPLSTTTSCPSSVRALSAHRAIPTGKPAPDAGVQAFCGITMNRWRWS
jgi:hypothetical protein